MEPPPREPSPPGTSPPEHDRRFCPPSPSQSSSSPLSTRRSSPRSPSLSFFFPFCFQTFAPTTSCVPLAAGRWSLSPLFTDARDRFMLRQQPGGFYSGRLRFLGPPFSGSPKGHFNKKRGNLSCASPARLISFFFLFFFGQRRNRGEIDFTEIVLPKPQKESRFPFLTRPS